MSEKKYKSLLWQDENVKTDCAIKSLNPCLLFSLNHKLHNDLKILLE